MISCICFFESSRGSGRLFGFFPEQSAEACAYRGGFLGLLAIHLILRSVNDTCPGLLGSNEIFSDCLGALDYVSLLPPNRIPSKCKHSDILKKILIVCSDLTFSRTYSHVSTHQDECREYSNLSRQSQLNCVMDGNAKMEIWDLDPKKLPVQG